MRKKALIPLLALALPGIASAYETVDLSPVANARFDTPGFINGSTYPTTANPDDIVTLDGVPFLLPASGNYMWHSELAGGENPRSADISVGVYGVDAVYTLMGTWWGEDGFGTYASIEFFGSGGAYYKVDLDGGAHIRDYNFNPSYTTTLDAGVTKEVWSNGSGVGTQHIDRQLFDLPDAFNTQTLDHIIVSDNGSSGFQRTFVAAVTVAPVPEPETWAMLLAGLGVIGLISRRRAI